MILAAAQQSLATVRKWPTCVLGVCAAETAIRGRTDVQVEDGSLDLGHELSAL